MVRVRRSPNAAAAVTCRHRVCRPRKWRCRNSSAVAGIAAFVSCPVVEAAAIGLPRAVAPLATSVLATSSQAFEEPLPPLPRASHCEEVVAQLREELSGLSADVIDRFALAADVAAATNLGERFAVLAARNVVAALLRLAEAGQLQFACATGCGVCSLESHHMDSVDAAREIGLTSRYRRFIVQLQSFAMLLDGHGDDADGAAQQGKHDSRVQSEASGELRAQRKRAAESIHKAIAGETGAELARPVNDLMEATEQARLFKAVLSFMVTVGKLHGTVISALDAVTAAVLDSRVQSGTAYGQDSSYGAGLATPKVLLDYVGGAREETQWPLEVILAGGVWPRGRPFSRSSTLCDEDAETLYGYGATSSSTSASISFTSQASPFRDSSGSHSWHGASARDLLDSLARIGEPASRTFWSLRPDAMRGRDVPCNEAHGIFYDPTACLERAGWGGLIHYVLFDEVETSNEEPGSKQIQRYVRAQWRAGSWADERAVVVDVRRTDEHGSTSSWVVSMKPPPGPVDVLFISPMSGNCALLPDLVSQRGSPVRLVYVPINPTLPPPLRVAPDFLAHWRTQMAWGKEIFQQQGVAVEDWLYRSMSYHFLAQCSLSQVADMLNSRGYDLLHVEHFYAVFAKRRLARQLRGTGLVAKARVEDDPTGGALFEPWREGWFCSPLSRTSLGLEELAAVDASWIGVGAIHSQHFALDEPICAFLLRHHLRPDRGVSDLKCAPGMQKHLDVLPQLQRLLAEDTDIRLVEPLALRRRMRWAEELQDPALGVAYHLGRLQTPRGPRGHCVPTTAAEDAVVVCECFAPMRGSRCDEEDPARNAQARERPYEAAINYIVNDEPPHIAELAHALRNLWNQFNERHDYPVIVFHDGLSYQSRMRIVLEAPHRIWFHRVPPDFEPLHTELPPDLGGDTDKVSVSHHTFSVGYRAQSRFRAGPIFAHPAISRLDYTWGLDTDSHLPTYLESDPFDAMHRNRSLVLAYEYLTVTSYTSTRYLWDYTLLFLLHLGADVVEAKKKSNFLSKLLVAPGNFQDGPAWNHRVVMTDCEILRVSFFKPRTLYYKFFEYLDATGGFWHHRWGDHAVRALGVGAALWHHNIEQKLGMELGDGTVSGGQGSQGHYLTADEMMIPYAHQGSCFCLDAQLRGVVLVGKEREEAIGDPVFPKKKKIWSCRPIAEVGPAPSDDDGYEGGTGGNCRWDKCRNHRE